MQKGLAVVYVLAGILVLVIVVGGAYFFGKLPIKPTSSNPKACIQDAKQCPDGSYVSRTGPNCEFKACPVAKPSPSADETANWKTYTAVDSSYLFKYPQAFKEQNGAIYTELPPIDSSPDVNMIFSTTILQKTTYHGPLLTDPIGTKKEIADKTFEVITDKLILNGRSANKLRIDVLPGSQTENVSAIAVAIDFGSNILYVYSSNASLTKLQEYHTNLDQILSTFRFIP